jgi:GTP-binding protein Era
MREVDLLALVVDVTESAGKGDRYVLDLVRTAVPPVFLILNKVDLVRKSRLLPMIEDYSKRANFAEIVPLSATTGENVEPLERAIVDRLPEGERHYPDDYLTDRPERFFAAEIVREKVLQLTRDELPYSIAVVVDRFEEPDPGVDRRNAMVRLHCTIVVDRESQKPIVIGRGGDMIKRIGSAARLELEQLLEARVFLDLRVRVRSDWREDDRLLGEMGVGDP